jgi:hypothetical protein
MTVFEPQPSRSEAIRRLLEKALRDMTAIGSADRL